MNPEDFDRLWALAPDVRRYLRRVFPGTPDVALEDILQDTYLAIWRQTQPYRHECAPLTYLTAIAKRIAVSHWRSARTSGLLEEITPAPQSDPADEATAALHRADQREQVRQALAMLPPLERHLLRLRYIDGLTPRQAARELGLPLNRVRVTIRNARSLLRCALGQLGDVL